VKQVRSWLSTSFRPAFDRFSTRTNQLSIQLSAGFRPARLMECGLYLPPGRGDIPSQVRLVLDLATPEGCKAELTKLTWLHTKVVYPPEDGHPSQ